MSGVFWSRVGSGIVEMGAARDFVYSFGSGMKSDKKPVYSYFGEQVKSRARVIFPA